MFLECINSLPKHEIRAVTRLQRIVSATKATPYKGLCCNQRHNNTGYILVTNWLRYPLLIAPLSRYFYRFAKARVIRTLRVQYSQGFTKGVVWYGRGGKKVQTAIGY